MPTPKVLDDVQGGAPGETLHGPQLQLGQGTGQGLQLIGAPLPPVQKHAEAQGGLPARRAPSEAGRPRGPASPRPGRSGCRGFRRAAGPLGLALGRQARPSPGRRAFWERLGGLALTNGQGPGPTQSSFLPLLQTFYKFRLPGPLGAPTVGMGWPSGHGRGPGKSAIVSRSLCSVFRGEKCAGPGATPAPSPPLASDPSPQLSLGLAGFLNGQWKHPWGCRGMTLRAALSCLIGHRPQEAQGLSPSSTEQRPRGGLQGSEGRRHGPGPILWALTKGLSPPWAGRTSPGCPPVPYLPPQTVTHTNDDTTHPGPGRHSRCQEPLAWSRSSGAPCSGQDVGWGWGWGQAVGGAGGRRTPTKRNTRGL